jgi:hypothetical protein
MASNILPASLVASWHARSQRGAAGLLLFGWTGTIVGILVLMVISFALFGYGWPYWRRGDSDIMFVYQAYLLNSGRPQDFFDHPGYLTILLLDGWFRLLHSIGLLGVISLTDMPSASDPAHFEQVWTAGVRAARTLSLVVALAFVSLFAVLLRRIVPDWRVAALGTFMLAFSAGVMWLARVVRTELLSTTFVTLALLLLLYAARFPGRAWRPLIVGLAAMLCTLGMVDKVQAIVPAMAWTIVVLFFGTRANDPRSVWRCAGPASLAVLTLAGLTILAAIPAAHLIEFGLSAKASSIFPLRPPPFGINGLYQVLLAAWVLGAVIIYALIWRVPLLETAATLLVVCLGVATGLLSLEWQYHPQNVIEVINPLELMFYFAAAADPQLGAADAVASMRLIQSVVLGFLDVLARLTFVLHTSARATVFLQWLVILGICTAWIRGQRLLAAQAGILLLAAWGIDTVSGFRGLKIEYSALSDPAVVIAAAWLLANLPELGAHRWAMPIGALLIALHVILSQFEPIKFTFLRRSGPEQQCQWMPRYTKLIERFPFCPPRT